MVPSNGGSAQLPITASCAWKATFADSWAYAFPSIGAGTSSLTVSAGENSSATPRSTTVNVEGQTATIVQPGTGCSVTATPDTIDFPASGGSNTFTYSFNSECVSNLAAPTVNWLHITNATTSGSNTLVSYSVDANTASTARTGTFQVNQQLVVISQAGTATTATPLLFVPVTPCRVADTRSATGPFGGPIVSGGSTRTFLIQESNCGIPTSAQAYALNVTVVPTAALGYLTVWPEYWTQPTASTLNSDGRVKANAAIVPAGFDGGVSVYASNDTHVVLDITGYFVPASANIGLAFYPVTPCRVVDTRLANAPQGLGAPSMAAGQSRDFPF